MPQLTERLHMNRKPSHGSRSQARRTTEPQADRTIGRPHARISDPVSSRAAAPVSQVMTVKSKELDRPPFRISARAPSALPAATPAWTTNGEIHVSPVGLLMPRQPLE